MQINALLICGAVDYRSICSRVSVISHKLFFRKCHRGVAYRTGTKTNWVTYTGASSSRSTGRRRYLQEDEFYQSRAPII